MRILVSAILGLGLAAGSAATPAEPQPPFAIVKNHIEVEVRQGGSYLESREAVYRVLTEAGAQALRQTTLSYTQGFQSYTVVAAYTLKADGTRIDVDRRSILNGFGATTSPGFQDLKTATLLFPNLEIGDEVVLTTLFTQQVPWFGDQYTEEFAFSRLVPAADVSLAVTAPSDMALQIDAAGLQAGPAEAMGGKTRWTWQYSNPVAALPEQGAVDEYDTGPRVVISSFKDYRSFADVYAAMIKEQGDVTPQIRELADKLTSGLTGDREQARALYEWVSLHIAYVEIVLGAGGFVPHSAADVLANKFGDCKDHVILLEALLAAKGIASSPVLINAMNRYALSPAASPFGFNHMITYIPELKLYLDSTARYAPFGTLPFNDTGKPVVRIASRDTALTPVAPSRAAAIRAVETIDILGDGTIEGLTKVTASGGASTDMRALVQAVSTMGDAEYFHRMIGPGAEGTLDQGDLNALSGSYTFSAHYRLPNALSIPGPAAIPSYVGFKPFSLTAIVAGDLPATRTRPYACPSLEAEEDQTINLPAGMKILAMPPATKLAAEGIWFDALYVAPSPGVIHATIHVRVDHAEATCSAAYYAQVRGTLAQMAAALRAQILYQ
ncbi:MAG TPA: DUF3857 domain-containing protein [Rhizomicrobium sp.]|nr:DUF3857 domain-containing protein [Rhizomicrobium sp.]